MANAHTPESQNILEKRRSEDFSAELQKAGWYHSIDLPDGRVIKGFLTLEEQRERFAEFPFASSLAGKRLLDIGTWDGWFAFEAERRSAEVVAVDKRRAAELLYSASSACVEGPLRDRGGLRAAQQTAPTF